MIVRVRQGTNSDLTVKVRVPDGRKQVPIAGLDALFPCEMNWTGAGIDTDYSVNRRYKTLRVPQTGDEISHLLSSAQKSLLQEARLPINWSRVTRIASINATSWESIAQSPFPKLALELWEWPAGSILEVSAKVGSDAGQSKSTELRRPVNRKSLRLSASQGSKTSLALDTVTRHTARRGRPRPMTLEEELGEQYRKIRC